MKKAIQTIITAILIACMFSSVLAFADSRERPWKESDTVKIINHVVYELKGEHWEVADFFDTAEASESKDITKIEIKDSIDGKPVTEIQNMNYYYVSDEWSEKTEPVRTVFTDDNEFVTEIVLPETIKVICHDAFNGFRSVKSINIPEGVEKIGANAFDYCSDLESLTLPAINGKTLAVYGCENLKELKFTGGPEVIGSVKHCYELSTVKIPESVKKLGSFEYSGLTKIALRNTVTVSKRVFMQNTKLEKVVFKNKRTVKKYIIPSEAFCCTPKLTDLRMPKAKKIYIKDSAFRSSGIKTVSTKNVVSIGFEAFADCKNLEEFTVPKTVKKLGNKAFNDSNNLKKLYINTKNTKVITKSNALKYLNKKCRVYVKTKAMKEAVKKAGFIGKVIIR